MPPDRLCDGLYTCNKFRLKPAKLAESGKYEGWFNGESNIGRRWGTILFGGA